MPWSAAQASDYFRIFTSREDAADTVTAPGNHASTAGLVFVKEGTVDVELDPARGRSRPAGSPRRSSMLKPSLKKKQRATAQLRDFNRSLGAPSSRNMQKEKMSYPHFKFVVPINTISQW